MADHRAATTLRARRTRRRRNFRRTLRTINKRYTLRPVGGGGVSRTARVLAWTSPTSSSGVVVPGLLVPSPPSGLDPRPAADAPLPLNDRPSRPPFRGETVTASKESC